MIAQTPGTPAPALPAVRDFGSRAELAWDGLDALSPAAALLATTPLTIALALIERIRFGLGGRALSARIDSMASAEGKLRVRGPRDALDPIAERLRETIASPARLSDEVAKIDREFLRGWRPW